MQSALMMLGSQRSIYRNSNGPIRGTDVAKEVASMIHTDDNFGSIETAVKEGRKLFGNLHKAIRYYLECKVALVFIFLTPITLGIPLLLTPIQIIVLELFMDFAALLL